MNKVVHPRTAHINRAQKERSKKACVEALQWLAKTFPEAFDTEAQVRPLKIGIMNDLLEYVATHQVKTVSKSKLRQAVVMFTRRMEYLVCLKCQEERIDLHGNPVGTVSDEEALKAVEKIKKHVAKSIRDKHTPKKESLMLAPISDHYQPPKEVKSLAEVTVKRKIRRFDPDAVARLKEKLGIAKESA